MSGTLIHVVLGPSAMSSPLWDNLSYFSVVSAIQILFIFYQVVWDHISVFILQQNPKQSLCYSGAFKCSHDGKLDQVEGLAGRVHSDWLCGWASLLSVVGNYIIMALVAFCFDSKQAAWSGKWVWLSPAVDLCCEPGQVPCLPWSSLCKMRSWTSPGWQIN